MKRAGVLLMLVLGFSALPCRGAVVRTVEGKTYEGTIQVDGQGVMILTRVGASQVRFELKNILSASFVASPDGLKLNKGIVLTDGTAIGGAVDSPGPNELVLRRAGQAPRPLPIERTARVLWENPERLKLESIPSGKTGVLMANGDFLEGDFQGLSQGSVRISSVIFGIMRLDTGRQARLLVLRDVRPGSADYVVRLTDGSVVWARTIAFEGAVLRMESESLGVFRAPAEALAEIRLGGGRLTSLTELKPQGVEPPAARYAMDGTTVGLLAKLVGGSFPHAVGTETGVTLRFSLGGKYRLFTCRAGVAAGAVPVSRARFVVLVDGKEAVGTTYVTSVEDGQTIAVNTLGAKTLSLRAEGVSGEVAAPVLWADPLLLKGE